MDLETGVNSQSLQTSDTASRTPMEESTAPRDAFQSNSADEYSRIIIEPAMEDRW